MVETKLVGGKIPAGTVCPFKNRCEMAEGGVCKHLGTQHKIDFSCAVSRAFDIIDRRGASD